MTIPGKVYLIAGEIVLIGRGRIHDLERQHSRLLEREPPARSIKRKFDPQVRYAKGFMALQRYQVVIQSRSSDRTLYRIRVPVRCASACCRLRSINAACV